MTRAKRNWLTFCVTFMVVYIGTVATALVLGAYAEVVFAPVWCVVGVVAGIGCYRLLEGG